MTCASAIIITTFDLKSLHWISQGLVYEGQVDGKTRTYAVHARGALVAILASYEDALLIAEINGRAFGLEIYDRIIETMPDSERVDMVKPSPRGV